MLRKVTVELSSIDRIDRLHFSFHDEFMLIERFVLKCRVLRHIEKKKKEELVQSYGRYFLIRTLRDLLR